MDHCLSRKDRRLNYQDFLNAKIAEAKQIGFDVAESAISDRLKPHQKAIVRWMVSGGRRACFAAFGLGKTSIQLEAVPLTLEHAGGRGLIVCPLGVRQEFRREASERLGWAEAPRFIRSIEEADETGIYLTNYETVWKSSLANRSGLAAAGRRTLLNIEGLGEDKDRASSFPRRGIS